MYNSFFSNNLVFLFSLLITFSKSQEISFEKIETEIQNLCDTIVNSEYINGSTVDIDGGI